MRNGRRALYTNGTYEVLEPVASEYFRGARRMNVTFEVWGVGREYRPFEVVGFVHPKRSFWSSNAERTVEDAAREAVRLADWRLSQDEEREAHRRCAERALRAESEVRKIVGEL